MGDGQTNTAWQMFLVVTAIGIVVIALIALLDKFTVGNFKPLLPPVSGVFATFALVLLVIHCAARRNRTQQPPVRWSDIILQAAFWLGVGMLTAGVFLDALEQEKICSLSQVRPWQNLATAVGSLLLGFSVGVVLASIWTGISKMTKVILVCIALASAILGVVGEFGIMGDNLEVWASFYWAAGSTTMAAMVARLWSSRSVDAQRNDTD